MTEKNTQNLQVLLIHALCNKKTRDMVKDIIHELYIEPIYMPLIEEIMKIDKDLTRQDLIKLATYTTPDVARLVREGELSSNALVDYVIDELTSMKKLMRIHRIIENNDTYNEKLSKIRELATNIITVQNDSRVKKSKELETRETSPLFEFVYPVHRQELVGLFGFVGTGKTTLSLALIRHISKFVDSIMFVSIADWSEPALRRKLDKAGDFPEFWTVIQPTYDIITLEKDLKFSKPDVCILDAMTNITTPPFPSDKRYLQLGWIAGQLKRIAQEHDICMITTHQLGTLRQFPTQDDIQDSHSHILAPFDLILGLGKKTLGSRNLYLSTIKVRNYPITSNKSILLDYETLSIERIDNE